MKKIGLIVVSSLFLFACSSALTNLESEQEKINVLIVDGQNNHAVWPITTHIMKQQLTATGKFDVEIYRTVFTFKGAQNLAKYALQDGKTYLDGPPKTDPSFSPDFSKYDVVISNFGWRTAPWPIKTQKNFELYMENGGGFVSVHATNNAFPEWPAYNEMIGLGGWGDRNHDDGPYVYFDDNGNKIIDTQKGGAGGHAPAHIFKIKNRQPDHPIMQNLPAEWMHPKDELYNRLRGPAQNMTILASAFDDPDNGGTGRHEPVIMTLNYGKGRVFHTTLGHGVAVYQSASFNQFFIAGVEWAAVGTVTNH